ncbi:MGMT family protein [Leifsonia sp. fls2-241-R2A-40a]|uniref:MGMT family protein n=1 Tax=Leifsonia sp. fls2-241-R2A-40a TaxID=3040290 RepID=UPI00254C4D98|nr:MGMT family protein [Leifsonia sp. fls2-241-R2A-40a]
MTGDAPGGDAGADRSDSFVERVLEVVDAIPPGHVMTYGDVAATLGSRAARMVGQVMAYYGGDVPWWRVVRASGHPPANHEHIALQHYRAEGTPLLRAGNGPYRVDLRAARVGAEPPGDARNHSSDR